MSVDADLDRLFEWERDPLAIQLAAQTNQVLARMDGVDLAIKEATSVRETVGRVSEVTWSKVQHSSATILETQGYALRQLGDLAEKINQKTKVGDLAKMAKEAEAEVQKWLAVWLVASNCMTRWPFSNSTACWTRLRTSWTGIASD